MKEICIKKMCSACSTCVNICPRNAITMEKNSEGFLYPVIDKERCVNCGLCRKKCSILNKNRNDYSRKSYVGYNLDENIRLNSSSGGIFSLIADYVLENGGIVVGAGFDDNKLKHMVITEKSEMNKIRGSKYLQSEMDTVFKYVKKNVNERLVLFSGTPCQIAGLKTYLTKKYEKLICVDFICHGVPTPKLFDKYIKELECDMKDKIVQYNFRDKTFGWENYSTKVTFTKNEFLIKMHDNPYMKLFLSNVALRESCYKCKFKDDNRFSDITLGDFWQVEKYYPQINNNAGVSCIIVNTEKGNDVFNMIKSNIKYKECKLEEIIEVNPSFKNSAIKPKNRKQFFKNIEKMSLKELSQKYDGKISFFSRLKRKMLKILVKKKR